MTDLAAGVERAIASALGRPVSIKSRVAIGGGSINHTARLETTAGRFVVKSHPNPPEGLFAAEADGLRALRDSGTTLTIPRVIACGTQKPSFLVLEDLGDGEPSADFNERLGHGLAELHRAGAARYGFARDNHCGATPQVNAWTDRWVDFYANARLGYQVRLAARAGLLSTDDERRLDRLIDELATLIGEPPDGPSLIHGDLWSGNVYTTSDGQPALIDPAVSYSHREAEFGITTLFGGLSTRAFAAYEAAWPLDPGWRDRNAIYQLYHLLNHLNLFGRGYHAQVMSIVRRFV